MCRAALRIGVVFLGFSCVTSSVYAIPVLQLYLEGGVYNELTESWELTPEGSSGGEPFRIWAIGNIDGPGGKGVIDNVRLAVAYDEAYIDDIVISITPTTAGGVGDYLGFFDPSTPIDVVQNGVASGTVLQTTSTADWDSEDGIVTDGSQPVLGNGKALPKHGVFGPGMVWQEFALGDFDVSDSPIGDFVDSFPDAGVVTGGQINVYEVSIFGGSGATVHFDLYDTVASASKGKFAPFSHDADGDSNIIPEPASVVVWSLLGLLGLATTFGKRGRRRSA